MKEIKTTKNIIDEALKKSGKLREAYIKGKLGEVVGEGLNDRVCLGKITDKKLYLVCDTSIVANVVRLESDKIIEKINTLLKENYIDEIIIKINKIKK